MLIRKKLIFILLGIAVALLLVNTTLDFLNGGNEVEQVVLPETTVSQIEKDFFTVLYKYGISDDWITVKNISSKNYDSLKHIFFIDVPTDLPIALIINEFNQQVKFEDVKILSKEKSSFGNSSMEVVANNFIKLQAHFNKTDKVKREAANFSFIVKVSDDLSPNELVNIILKSPIELNVLLTVKEESRKYVGKLDSVGLKYSVLLDDDIEGKNFELDSDMSKEQLKRSIVSIVSTFGRQSAYIIDEQSSIYNSVIYNFIKDELSKRNVQIYQLSKFIDLNSTDADEIKSLFEFQCLSTKRDQHKIYLIDLDNLPILYPNILIEKKKGNKFIQPFNQPSL